jgi:ubiquitin C-terminal hydrolase
MVTEGRFSFPSRVMISFLFLLRGTKSHPGNITNYDLLHTNKLRIKKNIEKSDLAFTTREFMKKTLKYFNTDCILRIPFVPKSKIKLRDLQILKENEFIRYIPKHISSKNRFDTENNIERVIALYEDDNFSKSDDEDANSDSEKKSVIKSLNEGPSSPAKHKQTTKGLTESQVLSKEEIIKIEAKRQKSKDDSISDKKTKDKTLSSSDKSTTMTNKSNSKSLSPHVISLDSFYSVNLDPKGLYNPSVYCFMNTCMQCLISIPEINNYFQNEQFKKERKSKKSPIACEAMKEFIDTYSSSNVSLKAPSSLYRVCHSFLEANTQHDCQEFLRRFLGKMQEELNFNKKYAFPDKCTYDEAWQIYKENNPSFIDNLFSGLMRSSVICNKCNYQSNTYDPFLDLSVPIKKKKGENLENCLDTYFQKEFIDCEYKCSSCKKKTSVRFFIYYFK